MKQVFIIRGLPGAGKTTLAEYLERHLPNAVACSADEFAIENGVYKFELRKLGEYHGKCWDKYILALEQGRDNIIVHNVAARLDEFQRYMDQAVICGYRVHTMVLENRHFSRDVHNYPENIRPRRARELRNNLVL